MAKPLKIVRAALVPPSGSKGERYAVWLEFSRRPTATERDAFTKIKAAFFDFPEVPEQGTGIMLHGTTIEDVRDNRTQLSELVRAVAETSAAADDAQEAEIAEREAARRAEADRRRSVAESIEFD